MAYRKRKASRRRKTSRRKTSRRPARVMKLVIDTGVAARSYPSIATKRKVF